MTVNTTSHGAQTRSDDPWWSETTDVLSRLIRIDTRIGGPGERAAAEWVGEFLSDLGVDSELLECAHGRSSLVAHVPGADDSLDPLLIQMHLDVVPAEPREWTLHPLSGEIRDGYVWGRGAVDMKNMVAGVLTVVRARVRSGRLPRRPLVLAFFADEENAGVLGAEWLVREHPDLFEGCRVAIGEGGGYSVTLPTAERIYPVHIAEKGWTAIEVSYRGQPSHASRLYDRNPVRVVAEAVGRLTHDRFPVHLTPQVEQLLRAACDACAVPFDAARPEDALHLLGSESSYVAAGLRHTAHVTRFSAGYQSNVVPGSATAELDCRYLPGQWAQFRDELTAALGDDVHLTELARTSGLQPGPEHEQDRLFDAARAALAAEDPTARVSPSMLSGGTDATHLQRLGIQCFGFNPLLLPPELDYWALFHGIDERVPIESLHFSTRVLVRFIDLY